jgi:hypothetical protein
MLATEQSPRSVPDSGFAPHWLAKRQCRDRLVDLRDGRRGARLPDSGRGRSRSGDNRCERVKRVVIRRLRRALEDR